MPGRERAHALFVAVARALNAGFFLVTGVYCLLTYSAFAYQQFIKPHLVAWLAGFVVWHHLGFWIVLALTVLTLLRERLSGADRVLAWSYVGVAAAAGVVLLVRPVLPQVDNDARGLVLAFGALVPPIWLAILDHRVTRRTVPAASTQPSRIAWSALMAAVFIWLHQASRAPWRMSETGEIRMTVAGLVFGIFTSGVMHLLVFAALGALAIAAARLGARTAGPRGEYRAIVTLSACAAAGVMQTLVFSGIAFRGPAAWALSVGLGATMALVWSGMARRLRAPTAGAATPLEIWLSPMAGGGGPRWSAGALIVVAVAGATLLDRFATFDWDFLLQRITMLGLWLLAFGYAFGALGSSPRTWRGVVAASAAAVALLGGGRVVASHEAEQSIAEPPFVAEFALEGYASIDVSYRLINGLLRVPSAADAAFYDHLRANSSIQHVTVAPIDIDFARPLGPSAGRRPHIFLFVIDSLRPDYLSPYNPAVTFTPAIGAFARDAEVFARAFTRYGGTGLAVPSIWTGGMLIHKVYVRPFDPMNTLLKLLSADDYLLHMSMDPIVNELIARRPSLVELNRGVPIVDYEMCRTLAELQERIAEAAPGRPLFAYSLPQNVHISHVRSKPVQPGEAFDGFVAPVAAEVQRLDACFGRFIEHLKARGMYDDSVIVLTADHGDSLGESLRWGHSYTLFPEVTRIPLIVRVPEWLRDGRVADPDAVAFSTDITPTLYELLGHQPAALGPFFGAPLLVRPGVDLSWRRTSPFLLASSYGPVYAVLRDNGSALYIADGVNRRDYGYRIAGLSALRVGVPEETRAEERQFIRAQIDRIASLWNFSPRS